MGDLEACVMELANLDEGWTAQVQVKARGRVVELSLYGDGREVVTEVSAWYADRSRWDPRNHVQHLFKGAAPDGLHAEFKRS
jgi:hypothetical protein